MNTSALRIAGAALLVVFGIWAGAKFHSTRGAAENHPGVPVPAGEASAPNPSDWAQAPAGAVQGGALPPPKIPDRLPQFSLADRTGNVYTVGEQGPETLVMGAQGGTVIPHAVSTGGGGAGIDTSFAVRSKSTLPCRQGDTILPTALYVPL